MGVNEYTHLSHDEFKALFIGPKIPTREAKNIAQLPTRAWLTGTADAVDWRAKGAVTPVKNQGQCGSCWSFSATGAMEGAYAIASGKLVSLSEEDLVECDQVDQGCGGGLMDNAFKFVEKNGVAAEAAYPYISGTGIRGLCKEDKEAAAVVTVTGFKDVPAGDEDALKTAVAQQPVSVAIQANQMAFQLYSSGVLTGRCGTNLDHGVLAVGYGTYTDGTDYWKVKNSWASSWGMDGYILIERGNSQTGGQCGILMSASYPTV